LREPRKEHEPLEFPALPRRGQVQGTSGALTIGAASTLHLGVLPEPAIGASVALGFQVNSWWLLMNGGYIGSASEPVQGSPTARIDVDGWNGALKGCYLWGAQPLSVGTCLGVTVGTLIAAGIEVEEARTSARRWSAGTAGIVLKARLARSKAANLNLLLGVDVMTAAERPAFTVSGSTSIVRSQALSGAMSLGLSSDLGHF